MPLGREPPACLKHLHAACPGNEVQLMAAPPVSDDVMPPLHRINHPACQIALQLAAEQAEDEDPKRRIEAVPVTYHHTVGDSAVMEVRAHDVACA